MLLHDLMQELNQHWFSYWLACKAFEIKELSGFFCFSLDLCDNLWRIHISLRGGGCLTWSLIILLLCFFLLRCYVLYISSYLIDDFRLFWSLSLSLSLSLPHISNFNKIYKFLKKWSVCLAKIIFANLFYYLVYFYYYLWQECYCYSTIIVLQVKVRGILISMTFARRGSHNSRWNT